MRYCNHRWEAPEIEYTDNAHGKAREHVCRGRGGHDGMHRCGVPGCTALHACNVPHTLRGGLYRILPSGLIQARVS